MQINAETIHFYQPPEHQGQAVRVEYALEPDLGILRRTSWPDGEVRLDYCCWDCWYECNDDPPAAPWNEAPKVDEDLWLEVKHGA